MITKEHLEAKKAELTHQHGQVSANLNAISGAIEIVNILIAECDKPEPAQTPPALA